ncbi:MAG: GNAT family N-acetyltransferase [Pseudomonadota bacterium]
MSTGRGSAPSSADAPDPPKYFSQEEGAGDPEPVDVRPIPFEKRAGLVDALAALRVRVFAEYPYLYEGDLAYEREYLAPIVEDQEATLIGAFDQDRLVGASTGTRLLRHDPAFATALASQDWDLSAVYYCAESVLLPAYRGQGLGHRFFDLREQSARASGYRISTFCAVLRKGPMPPDYRPLDGFWRKRGYMPVPGAIAQFAWKDLGESAETEKPLQFWARNL